MGNSNTQLSEVKGQIKNVVKPNRKKKYRASCATLSRQKSINQKQLLDASVR